MRGGVCGSLVECVSPVRIRYGAVVGVLLSNRSAGDILYAGAWASLAEASRAGGVLGRYNSGWRTHHIGASFSQKWGWGSLERVLASYPVLDDLHHGWGVYGDLCPLESFGVVDARLVGVRVEAVERIPVSAS